MPADGSSYTAGSGANNNLGANVAANSGGASPRPPKVPGSLGGLSISPMMTPNTSIVPNVAPQSSINFKGMFSGFNRGSLAMAAGTAAIGGIASYAFGGNAMQGGAAGAFTGGMLGLASRGRVGSAMMPYASKGLGLAGVDGYAPMIANTVKGFENVHQRRAYMAAGSALGGFTFGGDRSHKRGFNSRRGNSIGR